MRLKTILNYGLNFKCFCIGKSEFNERLEPTASLSATSAKQPRPAMTHCRNGCLSSSQCGNYAVSFAMRCAGSVVVVEGVPWSDGKNHFTHHYAVFLAAWTKELSWKSVAEHFHTSWQTVCSAVEWVVNYGLTHRKLDSVIAPGVDEIARHKGYNYLTLVYQIDPGARRLLWIGENRTQETMNSFFGRHGKVES